MKNILILYATKHGQTAKIASHLRSRLEESLRGQASFFCVQNIHDPFNESEWPAVWDMVIIGAPLYIGRYSSRLKNWLLKNKEKIKTPAAAFYSVSLNAADHLSPGAEETGRVLRNSFYAQSRWSPQIEDSFAGAINYPEYSWWLRPLMQNKSRKAGGPTDLLKNHEMTDWDQVDQFAQSLAKLLAHEPTASAVAKIVQASPAPLSMNSAGKVSLGLIGFLTLATGLYFEQWWWSLLGLLILGGIFLHAYFWYTILD